MNDTNLSRRDFLKKTGKAALTGAAMVGFGSLTGCATFPEATRKEVDQIKWDCNPILPIPKNGGIYIGTNVQGFGGGRRTVNYFKDRYGKTPTFTAPGKGVSYDKYIDYVKRDIEGIHDAGVIPMLRYALLPKTASWGDLGAIGGLREIGRGLRDDDIKKYGAELAKLERPVIVCPFQQVNNIQTGGRGWAGEGTAEPFIEAYVRIHDFWKQEGALEKVLMGTKLLVGRFQRWQFHDPLDYIPPAETVDILGWLTNNICWPDMGVESKSFEGLFKHDYSRAVEKYPNIPHFIWEIACDRHRCNQAAWMDDALTKIEQKYNYVKAVNLDENYDAHGGMRPEPNEETQKVLRRHFANPRYIGNILPQKDF